MFESLPSFTQVLHQLLMFCAAMGLAVVGLYVTEWTVRVRARVQQASERSEEEGRPGLFEQTVLAQASPMIRNLLIVVCLLLLYSVCTQKPDPRVMLLVGGFAIGRLLDVAAAVYRVDHNYFGSTPFELREFAEYLVKTEASGNFPSGPQALYPETEEARSKLGTHPRPLEDVG